LHGKQKLATRGGSKTGHIFGGFCKGKSVCPKSSGKRESFPWNSPDEKGKEKKNASKTMAKIEAIGERIVKWVEKDGNVNFEKILNED